MSGSLPSVGEKSWQVECVESPGSLGEEREEFCSNSKSKEVSGDPGSVDGLPGRNFPWP